MRSDIKTGRMENKDWTPAEDFSVFGKDGDDYVWLCNIPFYGKVEVEGETHYCKKLMLEEWGLQEWDVIEQDWVSADVELCELTHCKEI